MTSAGPAPASDDDSSRVDDPRPHLTRQAKRVVKLLLFALVVHLFVIPQVGGARRALSVLGSANPLLIVAVVALEGLAFLAYANLLQWLLPRGERPSLPIAFGAVMASTGVNHVVPGGAATTAAVNYRLLGRAGVPSKSLGFALTTQAIGSAVVLNVLLWLALVVSIPTSGFHPLYGTAATVGAVLIASFTLAVLGMRRGSDAFADRIARLLGRFPRFDQQRIHDALLHVAEQIDVLAEDGHRLRMVLGLAAANWLLDAAALGVALVAFGTRPDLAGLLVAYGLANVLAAVPISPGGLGVIEAVLIPTLVAFGTPPAEASIAVVVYRLANFWLPIPVGGVTYLLVERANSASDRWSFRGEINDRLANRRSA